MFWGFFFFLVLTVSLSWCCCALGCASKGSNIWGWWKNILHIKFSVTLWFTHHSNTCPECDFCDFSSPCFTVFMSVIHSNKKSRNTDNNIIMSSFLSTISLFSSPLYSSILVPVLSLFLCFPLWLCVSHFPSSLTLCLLTLWTILISDFSWIPGTDSANTLKHSHAVSVMLQL